MDFLIYICWHYVDLLERLSQNLKKYLQTIILIWTWSTIWRRSPSSMADTFSRILTNFFIMDFYGDIFFQMLSSMLFHWQKISSKIIPWNFMDMEILMSDFYVIWLVELLCQKGRRGLYFGFEDIDFQTYRCPKWPFSVWKVD